MVKLQPHNRAVGRDLGASSLTFASWRSVPAPGPCPDLNALGQSHPPLWGSVPGLQHPCGEGGFPRVQLESPKSCVEREKAIDLDLHVEKKIKFALKLLTKGNELK